MISDIAKHVLRSKLDDLPFAILKNAVENPPTKEDFEKYINSITPPTRNATVNIPKESLSVFPVWQKIREDLVKIYGNIDNDYNFLIKTPDNKEKVWASLHNDLSDVIHLCSYGSVEWLLVDNYLIGQGKSLEEIGVKVVLEPGDILYMRGGTLHETRPLSERGSLIFMNLPHNDGVNAPKSKDEEQHQRKQFEKYIASGKVINKDYKSI